MRHTVFRNLSSRDTIYGLDLYDLVIVAGITNLVFRLNRSDVWSGKLLNVIIIAMSYFALVIIKRQFPPGYLKNRVSFLFRGHRLRPTPERKLKSLGMVYEKQI